MLSGHNLDTSQVQDPKIKIQQMGEQPQFSLCVGHGPTARVGLKPAAICMGAQGNTHRAALIHRSLLCCCSRSGFGFIPPVEVGRGPTLKMSDRYTGASNCALRSVAMFLRLLEAG